MKNIKKIEIEWDAKRNYCNKILIDGEAYGLGITEMNININTGPIKPLDIKVYTSPVIKPGKGLYDYKEITIYNEEEKEEENE